MQNTASCNSPAPNVHFTFSLPLFPSPSLSLSMPVTVRNVQGPPLAAPVAAFTLSGWEPPRHALPPAQRRPTARTRTGSPFSTGLAAGPAPARWRSSARRGARPAKSARDRAGRARVRSLAGRGREGFETCPGTLGASESDGVPTARMPPVAGRRAAGRPAAAGVAAAGEGGGASIRDSVGPGRAGPGRAGPGRAGPSSRIRISRRGGWAGPAVAHS